jgi:hypothetical protein
LHNTRSTIGNFGGAPSWQLGMFDVHKAQSFNSVRACGGAWGVGGYQKDSLRSVVSGVAARLKFFFGFWMCFFCGVVGECCTLLKHLRRIEELSVEWGACRVLTPLKSPRSLKFLRSHTRLTKQCGTLLSFFRAPVFDGWLLTLGVLLVSLIVVLCFMRQVIAALTSNEPRRGTKAVTLVFERPPPPTAK